MSQPPPQPDPTTVRVTTLPDDSLLWVHFDSTTGAFNRCVHTRRLPDGNVCDAHFDSTGQCVSIDQTLMGTLVFDPPRGRICPWLFTPRLAVTVALAVAIFVLVVVLATMR